MGVTLEVAVPSRRDDEPFGAGDDPARNQALHAAAAVTLLGFAHPSEAAFPAARRRVGDQFRNAVFVAKRSKVP